MEAGETTVARAVMRNREYLYNLRPYHGAFIAFTLHYPQEIRDVTEIEELAGTEGLEVSDANLEMAKTIIGHLSGDFVPADYRDERTETLLAIIRAKAEGKEIAMEPQVEREKVINLMEALEKVTAPPPEAARPPKRRWPGPGSELTAPKEKKRQQA